MLQKYKTETSLLFDEYKHEYAKDMAFLEDKISAFGEGSTGTQEECGYDTVDINSVLEENNQENKAPEEDQVLSDDKSEPPAWAKKLYRKIALISHPDRASEDFPKDKLRKIFLETADAMSEGEFEKLLGFALELGIEEEQDDPSMLPLLKKRVDAIKEEIHEIEKSPEWLWGEGLGVLEMRVALAKMFFARKGIDLNTEELTVIIQEMENSSAQGEEENHQG